MDNDIGNVQFLFTFSFFFFQINTAFKKNKEGIGKKTKQKEKMVLFIFVYHLFTLTFVSAAHDFLKQKYKHIYVRDLDFVAFEFFFLIRKCNAPKNPYIRENW